MIGQDVQIAGEQRGEREVAGEREGAGAELAVEQSVSHMLAVIDALVFDVAKIGWFLDHNGERVPW